MSVGIDQHRAAFSNDKVSKGVIIPAKFKIGRPRSRAFDNDEGLLR